MDIGAIDIALYGEDSDMVEFLQGISLNNI